ncbi:MAG: PIN domain-containing protein [Candidatus Thermoplasmatota archaeon]|nr:PIN domain-containing protein [Candidatus Thermoplasmatota archaeon]
MAERRKKPIPYFDSNVILDYIRKRRNDSVLLLETIKRRKLRSWSSFYMLLELTDKEQENKWIWKRAQKGETLDDILRTRYPRNLTKDELRAVYDEIIEKFMTDFIVSDIIYVNIPSNEDWDEILQLMVESNISIADSIHVIAAINSGCNVFITRDSQLTQIIHGLESKWKIKLPVSDPQNLDKVLSNNMIMPIIPNGHDGSK